MTFSPLRHYCVFSPLSPAAKLSLWRQFCQIASVREASKQATPSFLHLPYTVKIRWWCITKRGRRGNTMQSAVSRVTMKSLTQHFQMQTPKFVFLLAYRKSFKSTNRNRLPDMKIYTYISYIWQPCQCPVFIHNTWIPQNEAIFLNFLNCLLSPALPHFCTQTPLPPKNTV